MIFRSIQVSQFRKFRDSVTLAGLDDGLNVIAGNNEEGKSTVLLAIRAALFERYKSTIGESYRPYGQKVSPNVKLEFDLNDKFWTLDKTFSKLKQGGCVLTCSDGKRWQGEEAEEHLTKLLGFKYGHGRSKPELQGLPGLLWVEQGHAYHPVTMADGPKQQLHSVFDNEMTELLGGDRGEAVYRTIELQRSEYLDKRDKPRGDYKKLLVQVEQLKTRLADKKTQLNEYDNKLERLTSKRKRRAQNQNNDALNTAREELQQVRAAFRDVEKINDGLATAKARLAQADSAKQLLASRWQAREKLAGETEAVAELVVRTAAELQQLTAELQPHEERLAATEAQLTSLHNRRKELAQQLELQQSRKQFELARRQHQALRAKLKKASTAHNELQTCLEEQGKIEVTAETLDQLRSLDHELSVKQQTLAAAATRVKYDLLPGVTISRSGTPLTGSGQIEIADATELAIIGVGKLQIEPGGEELSRLRDHIHQVGGALKTLLARAKVASVNDADKAMKRLDSLTRQQNQHQAILNAEAPQGLSTLDDELQQAAKALQGLESQLADVPPSQENPDQAAEQLNKLDAQIKLLSEQMSAQRAVVDKLREDIFEHKTIGSSAQDRAAQLTKELDAARHDQSDEAIQKQLAAARQALTQATAELAGFEARLRDLNADAAQAEVERAQFTLEQLEKEQSDLHREIRDLEIELNALGQRGLAEEMAQAEIELADHSRDLNHRAEQASALDLLYQTMTVALESAKAAVARPIIEKMQPYLAQLLPDTQPSINQDLVLTGLHRDGETEQFESLSIGTREQLAIIVRLAYADLLTENGIPVTVILDDALVNSDDERRDRMKAILFQAARKYQVLVLTCHARDYRDAGGRFMTIDN